MRGVGNFLLGILLLGVGIVVFLMKVTVTGIGFYRFGQFSTGPLLLILLALLFVAYFITAKKFCLWLMLLDIGALIVSMVMGTRLYLQTMSALDLGILLGILAAGLGLTLRGIFLTKK